MSPPDKRRPLVVTDCDEVLIRMVGHFRDWLHEETDVRFHMEGADFSTAMRDRTTDEPIEQAEIWRLLNLFFDSEMARQDALPGAVEAIRTLSEHADVVVLTNLKDHRRDDRAEQLRALGLDLEIYTNQGPKGPALAKIVEAHRPSLTIFIDDLPQHHASAAADAPDTIRLHLCGEPLLAPHIDCAHAAGHAHARIDTWDEALPWLLDRLKETAR